MYLTVHTITGALIGSNVNNLTLSFVLGLISHYILDAIPHYDAHSAEEFFDQVGRTKLSAESKKFLRILIADLSFSALSVLAILYYSKFDELLPIIAGVAGATLPDFLNGIYFKTKIKLLAPLSAFHHRVHFNNKKISISKFSGLVTQAALVLIALSIIF